MGDKDGAVDAVVDATRDDDVLESSLFLVVPVVTVGAVPVGLVGDACKAVEPLGAGAVF